MFVGISTQLALLPPCDPASLILLSGVLIPRVEPQQTEGARQAPASQPLTHLVTGSAETKAPQQKHPVLTGDGHITRRFPKRSERRAHTSQAQPVAWFILSRCTCLPQRGTRCAVHPATENPQLLYHLKLKKNTHNRLIQQGSELVSWRWLQPDIWSDLSVAAPPPNTLTFTVKCSQWPLVRVSAAPQPLPWVGASGCGHSGESRASSQQQAASVRPPSTITSLADWWPPTQHRCFVFTPHPPAVTTGISISALGWIQFMRLGAKCN